MVSPHRFSQKGGCWSFPGQFLSFATSNIFRQATPKTSANSFSIFKASADFRFLLQRVRTEEYSLK